ncbi:CRISPR-associated endonuclease Cas2 [Calditrichota bacterium LG25]
MSHWLVIYDIRDEKRLQRVARTVKNYGVRAQKSVFELEVDSVQIAKLRKEIQKIIADEDYVVYFNLCEADWQKREKYGGKFRSFRTVIPVQFGQRLSSPFLFPLI